MKTYAITELVDEFGLTLRTLRFWESRALIKPARRGTTRIYSETDRENLIKIIAWRAQRFTVEEIKIALNGNGFSHRQRAEQFEYLSKESAELDQAIADLRATLEAAADEQ